MALRIGDEFPNIDVETTHGKLNIREWQGDSYAILFTHPADYTPVCTTELGRAAKLVEDFKKRNVKMIAMSCDSVEDHLGWIKDIQASQAVGGEWPYPIIADKDRELAIKFGMLDPAEKNKAGLPVSARAVVIIGPDYKVKLTILYPATTGRNFDEILRVVDSLQLTADYKVATPADWKHGEKVMITPGVSNEEAKEKFPGGWETAEVPSGKGYIRLTAQPGK
eukprot:Clim_evm13s204 gene=Clim_evmTU13s204